MKLTTEQFSQTIDFCEPRSGIYMDLCTLGVGVEQIREASGKD